MRKLDQTSLRPELPTGRSFQVIGFGENAVDLVCRVPHFPENDSKVRMERMRQLGGGQVATASSFCARYGLKTRYIGCVGDDDLGEFARRDLSKEPMDVLLDTVKGSTSHLSIIIVDRLTGSRTIVWDRDPKLKYEKSEINKESLIDGQVLHLDANDLSASIHAARWAKESGMKVCLDIDRVEPGVKELLALVDYLIPNTAFVLKFAETSDWRYGLEAVDRHCPGIVIVTRGALGAAVWWDGEIFEFPAYTIKTVDSTGAGDVFHGAFLFGLFRGWTLGHCLEFCNAAGALACTKLGARAGIPDYSEVLPLVTTRVPDFAQMNGAGRM